MIPIALFIELFGPVRQPPKACEILLGDNRETLRTVADKSVQMVVTSPPYFGLRDYGHPGQMGLEATPEAFVSELVGLFREVRRVLKDDGTVWLNLGDSYSGSGKGVGNAPEERKTKVKETYRPSSNPVKAETGLGAKQLIGIPWRVAFALQADGWILRQDIIWSKPNPMPESVRDRCTKGHEYIFLLSKSEKYFFDWQAMQEDAVGAGGPKTEGRGPGNWGVKEIGFPGERKNHGRSSGVANGRETRNRRSVWTVNTKPYKGAHFATFPPALIEPCILAGSRPGDVVLDPFGGSGTTGQVALQHGRRAILCELNEDYLPLIEERVGKV